ncbi:TPA: DNA polymerase III, subunit gamma and tau [bacterium]|nr:DNA polymerase III, subunit gamma and tau [bacterium]
MYLNLARKYRPKSFDEVVGQEHITKTLINAVRAGRISPAYLFFGPRGCGKTSVARILAKCLNCKDGPSPVCCCKCSSCLEIDNGSSLDVIEIDGASNRGIDQIRELREKIGYVPISGRYKVYIIDEVHMLTQEAFNALLKTLEEPPFHAIFVFATTEPYRLPKTIVSRTQGFEFRTIEKRAIKEHLLKITGLENFNIKPSAIETISKYAQGSLRDGEVILEQVALYKDAADDNDVRMVLGICKEETVFLLIDTVKNKKTKDVLSIIREMIEKGFFSAQIIRDILEKLREMIVEAVENNREIEWYIKASEVLCEAQERIKRLPDEADVILELSLVKLSQDGFLDVVHEEDVQIPKEIEIDKDSIMKVWDDILERVGEAKPTLKPVLSEAKIIDVSDGKITVSFDGKNTHRRIMEKDENKKIVEDIFYDLFNKKISFTLSSPEKIDIIEKICEIFSASEVK